MQFSLKADIANGIATMKDTEFLQLVNAWEQLGKERVAIESELATTKLALKLACHSLKDSLGSKIFFITEQDLMHLHLKKAEEGNALATE